MAHVYFLFARFSSCQHSINQQAAENNLSYRVTVSRTYRHADALIYSGSKQGVSSSESRDRKLLWLFDTDKQAQVWTHFIMQMVFLSFFLSFLFIFKIFSEGIETMNEHIWNYLVHKKWINTKICFSQSSLSLTAPQTFGFLSMSFNFTWFSAS